MAGQNSGLLSVYSIPRAINVPERFQQLTFLQRRGIVESALTTSDTCFAFIRIMSLVRDTTLYSMTHVDVRKDVT